jgi:hypothetical protein
MTVAVFILGAFAIGFLLGDRRGVKQANTILDENMRVVMSAISEAAPIPDAVDDDPAHPTVH